MAKDDLFSATTASDEDSGVGEVAPSSGATMPLAARMRPRSLDDIVGQDHILGEGRLLRRVIEADRLTNLIFFGPPGCGKTSLAEVIAKATQRRFERVSGVVGNVASLRSICEGARHFLGIRGTVLFIDEIHRFNKAQQDVLLPYVEDGTVGLIGASRHNPQIVINTPLTSRSLVFELKPLGSAAVGTLLRRALADADRGLGRSGAEVSDEALAFLADVCEGDARRALTALEVAVLSTPRSPDGAIRVDAAVMQDCVQRKMLAYDRDEDGHYDTISAFIKSMRGSDPHAAVYWLAKMLEAGEDPGMPEARIILAHAATYLATAPKSNASYMALEAAAADVRDGRVLPVPEHLKNVHVEAAGKEEPKPYLYPHDFAGHHVDQVYLPTEARYYKPGNLGYEETIAKRMKAWEDAIAASRAKSGAPKP